LSGCIISGENDMRQIFGWFKRRFHTFDLLPDYFAAIVHRWHDVLWGASVTAVAFVLWWFLGNPSARIIGLYLVLVMAIAGYYVWRADHVRLMPRFEVPEKIRYHPTPTRDANGVINGMSVWIQLSPKCLTDAPVEQCSGYLREVRRWSEVEKKWKATGMNESLPLGWSFGDERHSPITLEPNNEKRLNVLSVHNSNKVLTPVTSPLPLVWQDSVYNEQDTFLFDITIRGKDCPPVDVYLAVKCGIEWDKPQVAFISRPDASTLSS